MRVAVIRNEQLEVAERPTPSPTGSEVLVSVAGAGVNRADLLQLMGMHPAPPGWPADIPGLEFAGTVSAVGDRVQTLSEGDRVFGILGGGGQASELITVEGLCVRVPESVDLVEAGGIPEVFVTAHDAMVTQAGLRSGERVLIHAVGSGVGTAAVQIARALGASTVGTARTADKFDRAMELGLDEAILAGEDMAERIGKVDVVLDLVGGNYLQVDVKVCRPQGRIVLVGLLSGASVDLDLGAVLRKRLTLTGTVLRARPEWQKMQATVAFAREVVPLFEKGVLKTVVDRVMPLDEVAAAYELLSANKTFGKVIISM
ncbi:MAG TPA: NAD(P)H-quinone oxidoreductase [Actinomycetota bacterium]|nr:NAD(P)H-quinone oxidoreductase [Actinomycetota bacterium]